MPVWRRFFSVFPTSVGVILFGAYQFDYPLFPNMSLLGTSQATIFWYFSYMWVYHITSINHLGLMVKELSKILATLLHIYIAATNVRSLHYLRFSIH